eukprot:1067634-Rhodomonas_salina.1
MFLEAQLCSLYWGSTAFLQSELSRPAVEYSARLVKKEESVRWICVLEECKLGPGAQYKALLWRLQRSGLVKGKLLPATMQIRFVSAQRFPASGGMPGEESEQQNVSSIRVLLPLIHCAPRFVQSAARLRAIHARIMEEAHSDEKTLQQSAEMQTPVTERVAVESPSYSFGLTTADLPFSYSSVLQPAGQTGAFSVAAHLSKLHSCMDAIRTQLYIPPATDSLGNTSSLQALLDFSQFYRQIWNKPRPAIGSAGCNAGGHTMEQLNLALLLLCTPSCQLVEDSSKIEVSFPAWKFALPHSISHGNTSVHTILGGRPAPILNQLSRVYLPHWKTEKIRKHSLVNGVLWQLP